MRRVGNVDHVQTISARPRPQVGNFPVRVHPDLFGAERFAGQTTHDGHGTSDGTGRETDERVGATAAETRRYDILARAVADEGAVSVDGAVSGRKRVRRRQPGDCAAGGVSSGHVEANDVAL